MCVCVRGELTSVITKLKGRVWAGPSVAQRGNWSVVCVCVFGGGWGVNWQRCHSNKEDVREPCALRFCRLLPSSISLSIFLPLQPSLTLSRPNRPGNGSPPWLPCQLPAALVVSGGERDNDITLAGLTVLILHFSCLSIPLFLSPLHRSTLPYPLLFPYLHLTRCMLLF